MIKRRFAFLTGETKCLSECWCWWSNNEGKCVYLHCRTCDSYILIWTFFPHLTTVLHQVQVLTSQKTHHYYLTTLKEKNILPLKYDRPLFERHILISEMLKCKKKAPLIYKDIWSASWCFSPSQLKEIEFFSWKPEEYSILLTYLSLFSHVFLVMIYFCSILWCFKNAAVNTLI